jgi:leucyl-tRNA synthetase
MSKSRGNVINPDDIIAKYGADTLRLYEMFIGDFEKAAPWSASAIKGCKRFLDRIAAMSDSVQPGEEYSAANESAMHKTIKKVTQDIESMKFNTAIAAMMALINQFDKNGFNKAEFKTLITLLNPFAPHLTEELNEKLGSTESVFLASYPVADESKLVKDEIEIAVQVNSKIKTRIVIPTKATNDEITAIALADEKVKVSIEGKQVRKTIVIPSRLINIIVG